MYSLPINPALFPGQLGFPANVNLWRDQQQLASLGLSFNNLSQGQVLNSAAVAQQAQAQAQLNALLANASVSTSLSSARAPSASPEQQASTGPSVSSNSSNGSNSGPVQSEPEVKAEGSEEDAMTDETPGPARKRNGRKRASVDGGESKAKRKGPNGMSQADVRRKRHKEVECQRRKRMADLFVQLGEVLGCPSADRASILVAALNALESQQARSDSDSFTPAPSSKSRRTASNSTASRRKAKVEPSDDSSDSGAQPQGPGGLSFAIKTEPQLISTLGASSQTSSAAAALDALAQSAVSIRQPLQAQTPQQIPAHFLPTLQQRQSLTPNMLTLAQIHPSLLGGLSLLQSAQQQQVVNAASLLNATKPQQPGATLSMTQLLQLASVAPPGMIATTETKTEVTQQQQQPLQNATGAPQPKDVSTSMQTPVNGAVEEQLRQRGKRSRTEAGLPQDPTSE